jgi:hypothetical protein
MVASIYKWSVLSLIIPVMMAIPSVKDSKSQRQPAETGGPHPIHISVIEINHNAADKTLEISCKIFTDDFEKTLAKKYNAKVDLINPPNKAAMDSLVKKYLLSHLSIKANGKPVSFSYLGFEHEVEAVYSYIEVENIPSVSKFDITTDVMYETFEDQMNILHVMVNGNRKSTRLNYPAKDAVISF